MEYNEEINDHMGITPRAIKQIFSFIKEVKIIFIIMGRKKNYLNKLILNLIYRTLAKFNFKFEFRLCKFTWSKLLI